MEEPTATDLRCSYRNRPPNRSHGNRLTTTRGGVTTTVTYLANGDRASRTDGNGKTWLFRYDTFGYPREAQSPLGAMAQTFYDDRGRQQLAIDANGARTEWAGPYPSTDTSRK